MKSGFSAAKCLVWLTQFGFSVVSPLLVCILGSIWLSRHFGIGKWIIAIGIIAGIGGAISGLINSLKTMERLSKSENDEKEHPVSFNDHK